MSLGLAQPAPAAPAKTSPVLLLPGARPASTLPATDDLLLDEIERASFRFFQEQCNPNTGLVRDRAKADGSKDEGKASIASSGFAKLCGTSSTRWPPS